MPLSGDGADTRYVHLLGHVGVHLAVVCPDCKRELSLMAQISSTQCGQDKEEAKSLSESEEIIFPQRRAESLDTFDVESRLSDNTHALETKRHQRKRLEAKRKEQQEQRIAEEKQKQINFENEFFSSFEQKQEAANNTDTTEDKVQPAKSPSLTADSSTIDPTEQVNTKRKITFELKPPPPKRRSIPSPQKYRAQARFTMSLDTVATKHPDDDTVSPLSK